MTSFGSMNSGLSAEGGVISSAASKEEVEKQEKRFEEMQSRWAAKLESRKNDQKERKNVQESLKDPTQNVDKFHEKFKGLEKQVIDGIEAAAEDMKNERLNRVQLTERLDALKHLIQNDMQEELAKAALYLPPYDIQQSTKTIAKLNDKIDGSRSSLAPRKKFGFKSKSRNKVKKKTATETQKAIELETKSKSNTNQGMHVMYSLNLKRYNLVYANYVIDSEDIETLRTKFAFLDSEEILYENKTGETIKCQDDWKSGQDVRLNNLENCDVYLLEEMSALRCINLKNCNVYVGAVCGSCFVENATDCSIYVACRQTRIHDSHRCSFYLQVRSRPIIEHCSGVGFAPYLLEYKEKDNLLSKCGLISESLWKEVDDFRWLRQQQSPNWFLIAEEDRKELKL